MKKILLILCGVILVSMVAGVGFMLYFSASDVIRIPVDSLSTFGTAVTLSVGDTATYKDGLHVTLTDVNDSRCPKGVQCMWAGELRAIFHVTGGVMESDRDIALSLEADGTGSRGAMKTVDGYNISLDSVTASSTQHNATFFVDLAPEKVVETPPVDVGNAQEKKDLIRVNSVAANDTVESPLTITGEARGTWYFEASFPVELLDADDNVLAQGVAQAQSDWMTEDFVPFTITLSFTPPASGTTGTLVLRKDNPSGDPSRDDALLIPVQF